MSFQITEEAAKEQAKAADTQPEKAQPAKPKVLGSDDSSDEEMVGLRFKFFQTVCVKRGSTVCLDDQCFQCYFNETAFFACLQRFKIITELTKLENLYLSF